MKLMRVGEKGQEIPVVEYQGAHYDASAAVKDFDPEFFATGGIESLRSALERGELPTADITGQRIGAPLTRPSAVICIGQNYVEHAAESGDAPPELPIIFFKTPNTLTGPNDNIALPPGSKKSDWEVELVIVIGKQAAYLETEAAAAECIAGYTLADDLSERAYQIEDSGGQWSKGKCIKDYMPLGPVVVTADEFDPHDVSLGSSVNGEPRQGSRTSDMIFSVEYIVKHLSHYMQLEPGDIISTGTPKGVALSGKFPYLKDGDVVEVEIEGIGQQHHRMVARS
ncbi:MULTISPECIES: fumarylacetoacetate hydrolase family protein [Kocuria]|uniref:fumarylacetoacetate hydrolase family protein n=1 Tax=Kocuria TaxID=57493 RepID=UPI0018763D3C|nr:MULTISPECIES: fumarylacetoacetate hydrolase family protein [Kocuria]MCT2360512.1 fumarylacetoacetate hydrolase family protein [Kocuria marina]GHD84422.1 2-hydroxyhepta-2,4-diene-1,7-dioate isomerase [Kocuria marina]